METVRVYTFWEKVAALAICLLCGGAGGVLVFLGLRDAARYFGSGDWPVVPCQVAHSTVEIVPGKRGRGPSYRAVIVYDYEWEGKMFSGERLVFGKTTFGDRREAEALAEEYPAGGATECRVNPRAPEEAVLLRELSSAVWLGVGLGGFFVCVFGALLYLAWPSIVGRTTKEVRAMVARRKNGVLAVWFKAFLVNGVVALFLVIFLSGKVQVDLNVFGMAAGDAPMWLRVAVLLPFVAWGLWEIRAAWRTWRNRKSGSDGRKKSRRR